MTIWTKGEHTGDELDDHKLDLSRQLRAYIGELAGYLGMTAHKIYLSTSSRFVAREDLGSIKKKMAEVLTSQAAQDRFQAIPKGRWPRGKAFIDTIKKRLSRRQHLHRDPLLALELYAKGRGGKDKDIFLCAGFAPNGCSCCPSWAGLGACGRQV